MPTEVIMPKVDMDMASGKLAVWHVAEGEAVKKGAALFDIETDKAAMEVEAPASGILRHILANPGVDVPVGSPVAYIYAEGEAIGPAPVAAPPALAEPDAAKPAAEPEAVEAAALPLAGAADEAPRATPVARRLAREGGIELAALAGTGPKGRIQRSDVEAEIERRKTPVAAPAPVPAPAPAAPAYVMDWTPQAGDLHVTTRKGNGVPLVMVHGFAADSAGWTPLERALPRDLPLIRIDLPSHGRSPLRRIAGFADLAKALVQTFDRIAEGPVHLLGHSLGGALSLALADIRPRQIKTLSLIAPAGLGPEIDGAALNGIARASTADSLAPWLKRLTARPEGISHDFAKAAMLSRLDPALRSAQQELAESLFPDGVQAFDLTAALSRVTAPTLMVWGRDDHILPWKQALAAPGEVALHLMRGVGHVPHMEDPEAVAALIGRHLRP
ncbi:acetoin dehydrogenase dihydrolipoyllysine-residue acetyltransferase subunit [Paragemmobacter straminiformis]|uniref:Acetoin dehydrogenase dihydrolipoyllysine-residue acetyltransferase subunit n=1 Tax=Paragemmobacter straminiformis TaxID=2045119 RepID=A0A842IEV7_9RHOB|nr:acetoin dehydrogenase dihydrolipoyllysine-residue acetyltransferase subunit [Gemmobacter straminiformis]MBC2837597.1 acetoin dehydrogenase dihydrolipoyllysine-residue acetyltransferase subunit [Gemmobacter straminiformis]